MTSINVAIDSKHLIEAYHKAGLEETFHKVKAVVTNLCHRMQECAKAAFQQLQKGVEDIALTPSVTFINSTCTEVEKIRNVASCLPFLGIIASAALILAGKLQLVAGIVVAATAQIGVLVESRPKGNPELLEKWRTLTMLGFEHVLHGCLNVLRGLGETLLSTSTFGIGSIALLIPNLIGDREFEPYFAYGSLVGGSTPNTFKRMKAEV